MSGLIGGAMPRMSIEAKDKRLAPINMDALPDVEEVRKAAKRVAAIQTDIASAKQRLATLEQQLGVTFDHFELALKTTLKPQAKVQRRRPTSKGQPK